MNLDACPAEDGGHWGGCADCLHEPAPGPEDLMAQVVELVRAARAIIDDDDPTAELDPDALYDVVSVLAGLEVNDSA